MRLLTDSIHKPFIVLLEVSADLEQALALLFPEVDAHLVVALDHLKLLPERFEFGHGLHLEVRFLLVLVPHLV